MCQSCVPHWRVRGGADCHRRATHHSLTPCPTVIHTTQVDVPAIDVTRTPHGVMRVTLPKVATSCRKIPITHIDVPPAVDTSRGEEAIEVSAEAVDKVAESTSSATKQEL